MCCFVFAFFFFQQKSASDMRISYWSSDVCSSDLIHLESWLAHPARGDCGVVIRREVQVNRLAIIETVAPGGTDARIKQAGAAPVVDRKRKPWHVQHRHLAHPQGDRKSTRLNSSH